MYDDEVDVVSPPVAGDAREELADRIRRIRTGGTTNLAGGWQCGRDLIENAAHGATRVERQNASALRIARWLERRAGVAAVHYPGLESHRSHTVATRQMRGGFGGVLSFELDGGMDAVTRFLPALRWAHLAANLGAVETVAGTPPPPPATWSAAPRSVRRSGSRRGWCDTPSASRTWTT